MESEVSKGSTFYFTVRLKRSTPAEIKALEYMAPVKPDLRKNRSHRLKNIQIEKYHILLAEDFKVNREVIQPILEKQGFLVTIVKNGKEALTAVQKNDYDLILMDIQMPVMNGLESTVRIRRLDDRVKASIPIIALTAHALKGDRERFLEAGMDEYVSKPVRTKELLKAISKFLKNQEEQTEQFCNFPLPEEEIDIEYGLKLLDNDTELLLTNCKAILKYLPDKVAELSQAASGQDYQRIARLAHSIKSVAKSMGAQKMAETAFDIEQSGNTEQEQPFLDLIPALNIQAASMLDEVKEYILKCSRNTTR